MNTQTLEQRVTALEELVKKIIALPHLSNLAGRDSRLAIDRLQHAIASDKVYLADFKVDDEKRKEIEERIARNEHLIAPALSSISNSQQEDNITALSNRIIEECNRHGITVSELERRSVPI